MKHVAKTLHQPTLLEVPTSAVAVGLHPAPKRALGSICLVQHQHHLMEKGRVTGLSRTTSSSLGCWIALCRLGWGKVPASPQGQLERGQETPPGHTQSAGFGTKAQARSPVPVGAALMGVEVVKMAPRLLQAQYSPRTIHRPILGHLTAHPGPHLMTVTQCLMSALWKFGLFGPDDSV